ncbi:calponin homology domain-containing protein DDB_G0272472-like isoform X2 [Oscarella lobularis]|uniref:calponin homology domain-containing protein DDB_G0272472-like isoform X2 n=1 Tax=Oscarella lobularis TaxID=121494 RepID=UPI00331344FA
MSRTEGFSLPRIPASHSKLVDPSKTWTANPRSRSTHTRSHSEPAYYTSYLCCPRQDVPDYVLRDAPTFDETFDKVGAGFGLPRLESAKVDRPLTSFEYDSLHDPHVRHLYMKNGNLRRNLISRGLVTAELKVVGSEREFREHVRAHEMFERKEIIERLLDEKERDRMKRMTTPKSTNRLPVRIQTGLERAEKRRRLAEERLARLAREKNRKEENLQHRRALQSDADKRARMERIRAMKLEEERKQRMARQFEKEEFNRKYDSKFKGVPHGSEIAAWHREAEILEHRIQVRNYLGWKGRRRTKSAEDYVLPCSESEGEEEEEEEEESAETEPQVIVEEVRQEAKEVENLALNLDELEKELQAVEEEETKKETEEEAVVETAEKETVLQPDPTNDLLQKIALEAFSRADLDDDGRLSHQEFTNVLQELNFELDEHEIGDLLLEANPQGSETIDYVSSLPRLRAMLVDLYQKRGDNEKTEGDTLWIPLYLSSSKSYVFFEKTSGQITAAVPPEWAPKIRDDLFVDTMMDIFTSGDLNQDGYIDRDEFYQLLQSPDVGLAYFSQSQADDLFTFFNANTRDGHMTFEEFLPLARTMIQLIYQNSDPSPYPWVELDSPKAGGLFWFNKFTSEVSMYPPSARDVSVENEAVDEPATPLSPVREQRSLLPPIQEAPSDRDTLSGSVGDVELVAAAAAKSSSAHPSLSVEERPSSPLPPPATPEVNNRPVDVSLSRSRGEKARSPERRRRRRRRKRTEAGDHEERRRRRRRHHSRRESERGRDSERAEEEEEIQKTDDGDAVEAPTSEKEEKEEVFQEEKEKDEEKEEGHLVDTAPIEKDEEDEPPLKKDDESTLKEIEPIEEEANKDEEIVTKRAEEHRSSPEESDVIVVQSDVEESPEKNLADDEKISLGVTSSLSLSKPRPSSAAKPPPSSRHSRTSLSSTSGRRVPEERPPITDEEKIESRRNSVAN